MSLLMHLNDACCFDVYLVTIIMLINDGGQLQYSLFICM